MQICEVLAAAVVLVAYRQNYLKSDGLAINCSLL